MINRSLKTRWLLAAGLTVGLSCTQALAQTAGQDMKNAGNDTKAAAQDAGHATKQGTKTAYRKTKTGTKTAARKTGSDARIAGDDTKKGATTAAHRTQNAGDAIAGKPEQH